MNYLKIIFLFVTGLVLFTACQTAPAPSTNSSGHDIRTGMVQLPGYEESVELTYEVKGGYAIWEGDIILGKVNEAGDIQSQAVATNNLSRRWPQGVIPYAPFSNDPALTTEGKAAIQAAIDHWNQNTVVRFVARTTQSDYIKFVPGVPIFNDNSCASPIGKQGGEQLVFLDSTGTCSSEALIHELGHAVGLHHEQSRTDRNSFVEILTENVQFPYGFNFDIAGDALNLGSYDYRSIMHYSCFAFSKNGQPTIRLLNPPAGVSCDTVGRGSGLSAGDITAVRNLYPPATLAWTQNSSGIQDSVEFNDNFGKVLATGDFNGDGEQDLAIGAPDESLGNVLGAGIVHVFYGQPSGGFNTSTDQLLRQGSTSFPLGETAEFSDHFGSTLATGDFNNDNFDDLAIGVPDEDSPTDGNDTGIVHVVYGSASGLSATNNQIWSQASSNIAGGREAGDRFGAALAAGDFNNNGSDDLAVGVPNEDLGSGLFADLDAGAINIIYGSTSRLTSAGNQFFSQDASGIQDETEGGDQFGFALSAADFTGNGIDDLAIGIPFEDIGTPILDNDSGAVAVIYGTTSGLGTGDNFLSQDSNSITVTEGTEGGDNYGFALAAADFNNDGRADLAAGSPGEDLGLSINAGVVSILYGAPAGVAEGTFQAWSQNSSSIEDSVESGDQFGRSLAAGRLNSGSFADLVIGVPLENLTASDAGAVNVIFGTSTGLSSSGDRIISQNSLGLNAASPDTINEFNDQFGSAVAIGDFDGNGRGDLAVGVPSENVGATIKAGMVNIVDTF